MIRSCADCRRDFDALGSWQRVCKPCYAAAKRMELYELRTENDRLRGEIFKLQRARPKAVAAFDPAFIRQLLMLTHPDKHDGSDLANTVTRKLLEMRGR